MPPVPERRTSPRPRLLGRNAIAVYGTTLALFATVFGSIGLRAEQSRDAGPASASISTTHTVKALTTRTSTGAAAHTVKEGHHDND